MLAWLLVMARALVERQMLRLAPISPQELAMPLEKSPWYNLLIAPLQSRLPHQLFLHDAKAHVHVHTHDLIAGKEGGGVLSNDRELR